MGNVIHAAERFRQNYNQVFGKSKIWACIDERLALVRGLHKTYTTRDERRIIVADFRDITRQRYHSTAGGGVGFGQDIHIATRIGRARRFNKMDLSVAEAAGAVLLGHQQQHERTFSTDQGDARPAVPAAHIQASVAAKVARSGKVHILNHENCAAEDNTLIIGDSIVTNTGPRGEDVFEMIKDRRVRDGRTAPLELSTFHQIQDAWEEAMVEGTIVSPNVSKPIHDEGGITAEGQELLPIARARLVPGEHFADTHLLEWGADVIYDREAARHASDFEVEGKVYGAYQTSMGSVGELHTAVASVFPVDQEILSDAMFVRNATTSLWLPRQYGEDIPVQLMAVGQ